MCAGAIGWSQLGRIVWGADDPKKGWRRYCDAVFHPRATVVRGVLAEECEELMRNFSAPAARCFYRAPLRLIKPKPVR